ncbi:MAG: acyl-CoA reductase, partial [Flavobacterium sp.]
MTLNVVSTDKLLTSFARLGEWMKSFAENSIGIEDAAMLSKITQANPWFTKENILLSFSSWADALKEENINRWPKAYSGFETSKNPKTIGVINAGNIPLVGLHDLLCVLASGHRYLGKNASDDQHLLPF